jgi:hypothetical protein
MRVLVRLAAVLVSVAAALSVAAPAEEIARLEREA